ncbi:MAG: zinc-binding dehydrogenase [Gammaproteobacteria bacterium]|nr:zinc-binding dehydrogenase [Gammaproteobacteria bacterium]
MSDLSKKLAGLPPHKIAEVLTRLRSGQKAQQLPDKLDFSDNIEFSFNSDTPFDFSASQTQVADPGPGCVQIRARAASLNFRDVMIASKMYPASPGVPSNMGSDYAGIVEKVGENVSGLLPGDEVIALHPGHVEGGEVRENSHFIKVFNAFEECVCLKPAGLSFEAAACIPTVFLTAYIALIELARLQDSERVLIHTAAGGVGLSAIQIAKWAGAEIYATASTEEKHHYLLDLGVAEVFDSRSADFARGIERCDVEMDVVLNTLSGDLMLESMRLLRPFGRFIHIDKKDIAKDYPLPMSLFVSGILFQFLDVSLLFKNPALMQKSLTQIVRLFEEEDVQPIKHQVFAAPELKKAITMLSRGTHIGKMVIQYE